MKIGESLSEGARVMFMPSWKRRRGLYEDKDGERLVELERAHANLLALRPVLDVKLK